MNEVTQEEMMLFGFKSTFDSFHRIKKLFIPFHELWTNVRDMMTKK